VRYGTRVVIGGTEMGKPANLRDHNAAFVYYFDSTGRPIEVPVEKPVTTRTAPALPVRFENLLTLEQYEVPSATIQRGKALIVFLNWRASGKMKKTIPCLRISLMLKAIKLPGSTVSPRRQSANKHVGSASVDGGCNARARQSRCASWR